ncbi:hypothetical protein [Leeia sp.]|uniref:hypothetical protein n=1 Tax=Leeia sp. TaxID=2884678 RepID=UPI0035AF2E98
MSLLNQSITFLYSICGIGLLAVYIPQALMIWRDQEGARAVSLWSWGVWTFTSLVTLLYAALVVKDLPWVGVSTGHLIGCATVYGLTLLRRRQFERREVGPKLPVPGVAR